MISSTQNSQDVDMSQSDDNALSIAAVLGGSPISNATLQGPVLQDYLKRLGAVHETDEYAELLARFDAGEIERNEYRKGVGALLDTVELDQA